MRIFFDSSSYAKRFVEEKGSTTVDVICASATELALSVICIPEIISALNRLVSESHLSVSDYRLAKRRLSEDVRDAFIVNLRTDVISSSIDVLETNRVRAMDALHVACALEWRADLFVSSDSRQIVAARKAGLRTKYI